MDGATLETHSAEPMLTFSTDEDTEDASEPEMLCTDENDKLKSRQEKLAELREQLKRIQDETDPELQRKYQEFREIRDKRLQIAKTFMEYELKVARDEYERDKGHALQELAAKKSEIKESLVMDLQEKKKTFENLRSTMEITTGSFILEPKMMITRKLRRRNYDTMPSQDKRRKSSPSNSALVFELEETEIEEDMKIICKGKVTSSTTPNRMNTVPGPAIVATTPDHNQVYEVRVDDGKLHYEGKVFCKNQHVVVESKDRGTETAIVSSISHTEIIVKLLPDNAKLRIYLSHLSKGKYIIKKKN